MSYDNRQEDLDAVLSLPVGGEYGFNMYQDGGALFERISEDLWEFGEVTTYGISYHTEGEFTSEQLMQCINKAYDEWL